MKRTFIYTLISLAAMFAAPAIVSAQTGEDPMINLSKKVTDHGNKNYTLTLETYATGSSETDHQVVPNDFVLVLDNSGSMSNNNVTGHARVAPGASLNTSTTYLYEKGGTLYYLKRVGTSGNRKWVYSTNSNPTEDNASGTLATGNNYTVQVLDHIYTTGTSITRKQALLNACASFVETVYENNPTTGSKHHIAIVWYGQSAKAGNTLTDYSFHELTETLKNQLVTKFLNGSEIPNTGDNTYCDLGLEQAYYALNNAKSDKRNKVTVFFTDGEPGSTRDRFSESRARKAMAQDKLLKSSSLDNAITIDGKTTIFPSKVYSVGLMSNGTAGHHDTGDNGAGEVGQQTNDKYRFMHYISSNYNVEIDDSYGFRADIPNALCLDPDHGHSSTSPHHGSEDPHGYFMTATDDDSLSEIFSEIANSEADVNERLTDETTVVLDAITNMFQLPEGVKASDIKLYTCNIDVTASATANAVKWDASTGDKTVYKNKDNDIIASASSDGYDHTEHWVEWHPWDDSATDDDVIGNYIKINSGPVSLSAESDYIQVTGYSYMDHFIGKQKIDGVESWFPDGQKFIIQFDIEADNANGGGVKLETNTEASGVYVPNKENPNKYDALKKYEVPVVNLPYIKIIKEGLQVGESAIFRVVKVTDATGATEDMTADGKNVYAANVIITKDSENQVPEAVLKLLVSGYYKVTETSWAWAYTVSHYLSDSKGIATSTIETGNSYILEMKNVDGPFTEDNCYLEYKFKNTAKTVADHAEANVNNNMGNTFQSGTGGDDEDDTEGK